MCNIWLLHDFLVYIIIFVFFQDNWTNTQLGRLCNFIYEKIFNPLIKIMFDLSLLGNSGRLLFLLCLLINLTNISYMNQSGCRFLFLLNIILLVKPEQNKAI